ncbi:hypothetical protein K438DRAFT_1887547 [Mycena galopus ATCC 62051]|nr:hypothetical protein K438DRAFT_1887547 [Mycena galopus ATCC 62051]
MHFISVSLSCFIITDLVRCEPVRSGGAPWSPGRAECAHEAPHASRIHFRRRLALPVVARRSLENIIVFYITVPGNTNSCSLELTLQTGSHRGICSERSGTYL